MTALRDWRNWAWLVPLLVLWLIFVANYSPARGALVAPQVWQSANVVHEPIAGEPSANVAISPSPACTQLIMTRLAGLEAENARLHLLLKEAKALAYLWQAEVSRYSSYNAELEDQLEGARR